MKAQVLGFGAIEVDGERYDHDIVIEAGQVKKRNKGLSKRFRDEYGHTPLSAEENIPWGGAVVVFMLSISVFLAARRAGNGHNAAVPGQESIRKWIGRIVI